MTALNTRIVEKLLWISTHKGKWVYAALLAIVLFCAFQMRLIAIDTDPENMLERTHPARTFHNETKQTFAMFDAIVVGVVAPTGDIFTQENLVAIDSLTQHILSIDGVVERDVMSFSTVDNITQGDQGELVFSWMMSAPPESDVEAKDIASAISRLPMLDGTLASSSGNAAAIYVPIKDKNESYRIAEDIRLFLENSGTSNSNTDSRDSGSALQWHITGLPVAEDQFGVEMFVQMGIAAPAAGLMIFVLLFVFFRNLTLISAPMVVAMATVIITMGALIGMGFTVHIMSSMIAIFLMPIAVVDSVHILSEFSDRYKPGQKANEVITTVVEHLFKPMLFTSLTSSAGFFSLMLTPIPPVQIFGAYIGFGILLAFVITLTFIPAYISRMSDASLQKLQQSLHEGSSETLLQRGIDRVRYVALNYKSALLITFTIVSAVSVWGITQIQINDNPVRWFKSDHEIRVADRALNQAFAGTYNAYIVIESSREAEGAERILAASQLPDSLNQWKQQTLTLLRQETEDNRLSQLSLRIDDALFDVTDDSAITALETLSKRVETIKRESKVFQQPENVALLDNLQDYLNEQALIGKSQSLSDIVKVVNRELRSGQDKDYVLPTTQAAIAQTLLQYQSSHRPQDLWHFVTPDYQKTLVWLQLTSGDNQDMTKVIKLVDDYFAQNPLPEGLRYQWAGKAYLNVVWQENMVAGMLESLLSAFIIVFLMMVVLFRSLVFGALAMLPLTITITFIYGAIGIVGKDYDMPIAVLSALTLGLSVDFAIHFLARAKEIYKETGNVSATLNAMFDEPASAITRNALVIALGFTPLLLAPLVPYITVGIFLASIMFISALVTLLVLPAAMIMFKRWVFKEA
ncbi:MMPL family transporter [Alteromonas sp. McT4-15]|uniref:efflux RND transporter permease subunit n=1 Tax=Alteromonas sp. McT4-15 TaxID=2881256 RepID=UPI001CF7F9AF|nr:MMPL family transporter [Alteromonas sp. McT4-15]MCB4434830.1 MMPL family transporter [Alteromonas sp. McT4-15]